MELQLRQETLRSFDEISSLLRRSEDVDTAVSRLISIQEANLVVDPSSRNHLWYRKVSEVIHLLTEPIDVQRRVGRPSVSIDINAVEVLLNMNFRATKIAKLLNVSYRTLQRRMQQAEISVSKIKRPSYLIVLISFIFLG